MNIMVATDGALNPERAADAVERCLRPGDRVYIMTALNVPAEFLHRLGSSGVKAAAEIAHEAGHPMASGDRAAERLVPIRAVSDPAPGDTPVLHALASTATARTQPVVDLLASRGIDAEGIWRTTENQTARTILQTIDQKECELLIIGSHGHGRFDGLLGSTGTKLVRQAPVDLLLIRNPMHR